MAIALTRPDHEIRQMPLVELAYEILKVKKEPLYFRDMMKEIQELRKLSDDEVAEVIARVFTEINIDGRFICIGQNVWGLNRWYPTDKVAERLSGKKFIRKSGDAFSDDDEDDEDDEVIAIDSADDDLDESVEAVDYDAVADDDDEEETDDSLAENEDDYEEEDEEEDLFEEEDGDEEDEEED